ncbi:MAG: hypothetical protein ACK4QL_05680 [Pseudanabaenaceae cyanobacterium]
MISYYFPSDPPYFLFIASLLLGLSCGKAFEMSLRQLIDRWIESKSTAVILELRGTSIYVPYLGIVVNVGIFLACGLGIFGFPPSLALAVAIPITLGISYFVWRQLSRLLVELERGGSPAMDLDSWEN